MLADTVTSARESTNGSTNACGGALGQLDRLALVAEVFAQHHELVAAEAGDGVLAADARGESPAHRGQELVAGLVAEPVVHQLEAVEVDEEHRDHGVVVGVGEAGERVLDPVLYECAVGEPGERVVQREMSELLRARVAVDRDGDEVAGPLEHRELLRFGRADVAQEEGEDPQEVAAVGGADGHRPEPTQAVRDAQVRDGRPRAVVFDVGRHAETRRAEGGLDVLDGGELAHRPHVVVRQSGRGDAHQRALVGVVQADGTGAVRYVVLDRLEDDGERLRHRRARQDELQHPRLGLRERGGPFAVGDVPEVADDARDRGFVQLVGPSRLDPSPALAVEHVELGVERLVGMRPQRFVERVALVDAFGIEVLGEAGPHEIVRLTPEDVVDRRTDVLHPAGPADDHDDVGGVLHERAEPRLALGQDDARLVRLVDETGDAPRHPDGGDARDHREHHRRARTGIVEDDDRGRREQRGPQHDHSGASVAHQAGIAGLPQRAHRRVHHRRCEQEVRDRPQRVERAAVGVGAVGHQPGVEHVGHQHRPEPGEEEPRGGRPARQREHGVHDDDDEQDVHDRVRHRHDPPGAGARGAVEDRGDHPLPHDRGERDRDHDAVDRGLAVVPGPRQPGEGDRQHRVGEEVQDVGVRVAVGLAEAALGHVEDDVAGREEQQRDRDQLPDPTAARLVASDAVDGAGRGDQGDGVEDERTGAGGRQQQGQERDRDPAPDEAPGHPLPEIRARVGPRPTRCSRPIMCRGPPRDGAGHAEMTIIR